MSGEDTELNQDHMVSGLEGQSAEQTAERQKIEALVSKVQEVNAQLGGQVAAELQFPSRTTLLFAKTAVERVPGMEDEQMYEYAYGVDSLHGPIYVSGELFANLKSGNRSIDMQKAMQATEEDIRNWAHPVPDAKLDFWSQAFVNSKTAVLADKSQMERIQEAKMRRLTQALEVVSKPITVSPPPSPRLEM